MKVLGIKIGWEPEKASVMWNSKAWWKRNKMVYEIMSSNASDNDRVSFAEKTIFSSAMYGCAIHDWRTHDIDKVRFSWMNVLGSLLFEGDAAQQIIWRRKWRRLMRIIEEGHWVPQDPGIIIGRSTIKWWRYLSQSKVAIIHRLGQMMWTGAADQPSTVAANMRRAFRRVGIQ